jgi:hypothetical protein
MRCTRTSDLQDRGSLTLRLGAGVHRDCREAEIAGRVGLPFEDGLARLPLNRAVYAGNDRANDAWDATRSERRGWSIDLFTGPLLFQYLVHDFCPETTSGPVLPINCFV